MKCLQCGSTDIVKDVRVVDRSDGHMRFDMVLEVHGNPDAWIMKDTRDGRIRANVCVDCGFVMLNVSTDYARTLKDLKGRPKRRIN